MLLLVGTYTIDMNEDAPGRARGISAFDFSPTTGQIVHRGTVEEVNPSYLWVDAERKIVYGVRECPAAEGAAVYAYRILRTSGNKIAFEPCGSIDLRGDHPCHLARVEDTLLVSCYSDGSVHIIGLDAEGVPERHVQRIQFDCPAPKAHAHCAAYDAKRNRVFICDLGCDLLRVFDRHADGTLEEISDMAIHFAKDSGPRHCVVHPGGDHLLVNCEHRGRVSLIDLSREAPTEILNVPSLPQRAVEGASGAAIRIDRLGKNVYVSERNYSVISTLRLDVRNEPKLHTRDTYPSGGVRPRDIAISPDGKWLLSANLKDHSLGIFRVGSGGSLQLNRVVRNVKSPTCLAWMPGL